MGRKDALEVNQSVMQCKSRTNTAPSATEEYPANSLAISDNVLEAVDVEVERLGWTRPWQVLFLQQRASPCQQMTRTPEAFLKPEESHRVCHTSTLKGSYLPSIRTLSTSFDSIRALEAPIGKQLRHTCGASVKSAHMKIQRGELH